MKFVSANFISKYNISYCLIIAMISRALVDENTLQICQRNT